MWVGFLWTDIVRVFWVPGKQGYPGEHGTILLRIFHGELGVWVKGGDVAKELVIMFYLLDDKSVINSLSHR